MKIIIYMGLMYGTMGDQRIPMEYMRRLLDEAKKTETQLEVDVIIRYDEESQAVLDKLSQEITKLSSSPEISFNCYPIRTKKEDGKALYTFGSWGTEINNSKKLQELTQECDKFIFTPLVHKLGRDDIGTIRGLNLRCSIILIGAPCKRLLLDTVFENVFYIPSDFGENGLLATAMVKFDELDVARRMQQDINKNFNIQGLRANEYGFVKNGAISNTEIKLILDSGKYHLCYMNYNAESKGDIICGTGKDKFKENVDNFNQSKNINYVTIYVGCPKQDNFKLNKTCKVMVQDNSIELGKLDGDIYKKYLANCDGLVGVTGEASILEALYLGKQVYYQCPYWMKNFAVELFTKIRSASPFYAHQVDILMGVKDENNKYDFEEDSLNQETQSNLLYNFFRDGRMTADKVIRFLVSTQVFEEFEPYRITEELIAQRNLVPHTKDTINRYEIKGDLPVRGAAAPAAAAAAAYAEESENDFDIFQLETGRKKNKKSLKKQKQKRQEENEEFSVEFNGRRLFTACNKESDEDLFAPVPRRQDTNVPIISESVISRLEVTMNLCLYRYRDFPHSICLDLAAGCASRMRFEYPNTLPVSLTKLPAACLAMQVKDLSSFDCSKAKFPEKRSALIEGLTSLVNDLFEISASDILSDFECLTAQIQKVEYFLYNTDMSFDWHIIDDFYKVIYAAYFARAVILRGEITSDCQYLGPMEFSDTTEDSEEMSYDSVTLRCITEPSPILLLNAVKQNANTRKQGKSDDGIVSFIKPRL